MSRCAWCTGHCSAQGVKDSHGICEECQARLSPNSPRGKQFLDAMHRGYMKMLKAGLVALTERAEFK